MKWGIIIMLVLGLVAAGSAALLLGTLGVKASSSDANEAEGIEVAIANKTLNAGTVITLDVISTEIVSKDELPDGNLVTSKQILGQVLGLPVVEGQILTQSCLLTEGIGAKLASQIPEGMRAFSVPITSKARPDHMLLYPGCIVDVLVEYKLSRNPEGEAYAVAMFRGLRVLAVSGESVIKNSDEEPKNNKSSSRRSGFNVSLLVEPRQVEALQLAAENGNITMSLRNPLDKKEFAMEGSLLNRDSLVNSGTTVPSTVPFSSSNGYDTQYESKGQEISENQGQRIMSDNPVEGDIFNTKKPVSSPILRNSRWHVEIHRGREKEVEEYDNPEDVSEETETKK